MSYKSAFGAVLLGLVLTVGSWASASSVHGVLQVVKGDVQIKSAKDGKTAKAKVGSKIFPKDSIITGKDSRAKIVMVDNNVINVSPESNLEIQNYEYAPEQGKKDVLLNVIYGKVRSKVEQKYDGKGAKFQVRTPTAVAGVRGTDFIASYSQENQASSVVTFEGKVEFGQPGVGGQIENPVTVHPGQMSEARGDGPPPPPQPVPPQQLAAMDKESKAETAIGTPEPRMPAATDGKKDGPDKNQGSGNDQEGKKEDGPDRNRGAGNDSKDPAKDRQGNGPGASAGSAPGAPVPRVGGANTESASAGPAAAPPPTAGTGPSAPLMPPAPPPPPPPAPADLEFTYVPPADPNRDPASTQPTSALPPPPPPPMIEAPPIVFVPPECGLACNEAISGSTNLIIRITNGP